MEKSFFFNAKKTGDTYDRVYQAEDFASYFAEFIGNGVFPNPSTGLQVVESSERDMTTILKPGAAFINGYGYRNTSDIVFTHKVADGVLNRKDAIFIRFDNAGRAIGAIKMEGNSGAEAVVPSVVRTTDYFDLCVGVVNIKAGITGISQDLIEDTRMNTEVCGIVHAVVDQIDTSTLYKQVQTDLANFKSSSEANFTQWSSKQQSEYQSWTEAQKAAFNSWFETLKGKLGDDPATNLQAQIEDLNAAVTGYPLKLTAGTNALQITAKRNSVESVQVNGFTSGGQSGGLNKKISIPTSGWGYANGVFYRGSTVSDAILGEEIFSNLGRNVGIDINNSTDFATRTATYTYAVGYCSTQGLYDLGRMYIKAPFTSVSSLQKWLSQNSFFVLYNADASQSTGLYIPIQAQGHEYRCQCLPITEALGAGDNVQSNAPSGCDLSAVLTGDSSVEWRTFDVWKNKSAFQTGTKVFDTNKADPVALSSLLPRVNVNYLVGNPGTIGFGISNGGYLYLSFGNDVNTAELIKQKLQETNLFLVCKSENYTEQADIPVELETHANGNVYAHDPVAIPTGDGATTITAPEGTTLEVSVSRNEAKTFKATLLMSAWSGSSGNYTQTAEVKCVDGPGFVSAESTFDSVIWVNQTENLDTNEKLVEALSIINLGYITLGDGTITCKVAEKPTCDIEIRFKALR